MLLEKRVLNYADAVITVSSPLVNKLISGTRINPDKTHVITNGYDPSDFMGIAHVPTEKFSLIYTGRLHRFKRDPELLFKVVSNLIKRKDMDNDRISLDFYVGDLAGFSHFIEKYSLEDVLNVHEFVSYKDSLKKQKCATVLLLFQSDPGSDSGVYTGKLFEYLGAKRPILSMPSSSELIEDLLNRTGAGVAVSHEEELETVLLKWYGEYLEKGTVPYMGLESEIQKYTREEKTKALASIFDSLMSGNR